MIEKKGTPAGKPPQYIISELSPTVRYFAEKEKDQTAMTTTINKLAVVGDQKKQTWFYYLKLKYVWFRCHGLLQNALHY